ncbi:hypothetical protein T439DRAFT_378265 [Meredithblackwellia eburnea MCA 4105]
MSIFPPSQNPSHIQEKGKELEEREINESVSPAFVATPNKHVTRTDVAPPIHGSGGSSPAQSVIIHFTPESPKDDSKYGAGTTAPRSLYDSPSPAGSRRSSIVPPQEGGEGSAVSSPSSGFKSADSSFEIVSNPEKELSSDTPGLRSTASTSSLTNSNGTTIFPPPPPGAKYSVLPTELLAFPARKKVTLTAPSSTENLHHQTPPRSRAWSALSANRPSGPPTPSPATLDLSRSDGDLNSNANNSLGLEGLVGEGHGTIRRRASQDGNPPAGSNHNTTRRRPSISPSLAPIPDDNFVPTALSHLHAHPQHETTTSKTNPLSLTALLARNDAFALILQTGKTDDGDLTRDARIKLAEMGLKSIPALHGPLSLPYARCPSGIDAFFFDLEKGEDPWTFTLEDGSGPTRRRRPGGTKPTPLPGNARYSQPLHVQQGRLPSSRIVSAPAVLTPIRDEFSDTATNQAEPATTTSSTTPTPSHEAASIAQILAAHYALYGHQQGQQAIPQPVHPTYQQPQTQLPATMVMPQAHLVPSVQAPEWQAYAPQVDLSSTSYHDIYARTTAGGALPSSTSWVPNQTGWSYPTGAGAPYLYPTTQPPLSYGFPVPSPFAAPLPTTGSSPPPQQQQGIPQPLTSYSDPAIVSYAHQYKDIEAHDSTYYGAASDYTTSDTEEPHLGGFFFPAAPTSSISTGPPTGGGQESRRGSTVSSSTVLPPSARRVSIPFAGSTKLAPVANADRRNSVAPTTRNRKMSLAPAVTVSPRRSSVAPQTRLVRDSDSRESQPVRQPRAPPADEEQPVSLVPHHSRPSSMTSLTSKIASRKNSKILVQSNASTGDDVQETSGGGEDAFGWAGGQQQSSTTEPDATALESSSNSQYQHKNPHHNQNHGQQRAGGNQSGGTKRGYRGRYKRGGFGGGGRGAGPRTSGTA